MTALYANSFETVVAKAASYTLKVDDHGKLITTRGASSGTVTFTLPATADLQMGWRVKFFTVGAAAMKITGMADDAIVTFNDADADFILFATGSEIIGVGVEIIFDGTQFLTFFSQAEAVSMTVDT